MLILKIYTWIFITLELKNIERFQYARHCAKWLYMHSLIFTIPLLW